MPGSTGITSICLSHTSSLFLLCWLALCVFYVTPASTVCVVASHYVSNVI